MSNATDMSSPVTRGELREELERFAKELGKVFATKTELEMWGGALLARIESGEKRLTERLDSTERTLERRLTERLDSTERTLERRLTERLIGHMEQMEERLRVDLAGHAKAHHEAMTMQISAMDDKYTDLPRRVGRLVLRSTPNDGIRGGLNDGHRSGASVGRRSRREVNVVVAT